MSVTRSSNPCNAKSQQIDTAERHGTLRCITDNAYPILLAVPVCSRGETSQYVTKSQIHPRSEVGVRSRNERIGASHDLLEIIAAHFAVESIALHALETPVREILTGVIVLAGILTKQEGQSREKIIA